MTTIKRAKKVKYSKSLAVFICDKIEEGNTLASVCRKYSKCPPDATIWRWRRQNSDFKEMIDTAYQTYIYKCIDEIEDISKEAPPKYTLKNSDLADKVAIYAEQQRRRLRVDTLKFIIAKLAPKMCPDLSDKVQVEHSGDVNQIVVQSYATQDIIKKSDV